MFHHTCTIFFSSKIHPPPRSTLFPYTTLFRSRSRPLTRRRSTDTAIPASSICGQGISISVLPPPRATPRPRARSEEHTSELQSPMYLVCRLLLEKKE